MHVFAPYFVALQGLKLADMICGCFYFTEYR